MTDFGFESARRCTARVKKTRRPCRNPALRDSDFCRFHVQLENGQTGGQAIASATVNTPERRAALGEKMRGNTLNLVHGQRSQNPPALSDAEKNFADDLIAKFSAMYGLDDGIDKVQVCHLVESEVRVMRARAAYFLRPNERNELRILSAERRVSELAKALGVRRDVRAGVSADATMAALLAPWAKEIEAAEKAKLAASQAANPPALPAHVIIDIESNPSATGAYPFPPVVSADARAPGLVPGPAPEPSETAAQAGPCNADAARSATDPLADPEARQPSEPPNS